ncbi:uncharacterized protein LOC107821332 [Nicotiana tabacum]|uniref:Uncharacterized protein LOC107821332 n=1 Tax=Nicotiana tabacum TaxID=4097 RepID=A0AC58RW46_TOBAC
MDFLVDKSQAGFVPGRLLNDNILLGHELVKGYCWKGVSPRCMVKIDMQKAYDSLEWVFLEQVLTATNIPSQFLKWIMTCVSTVSYSIMINGKPTAPFDAKRGVRQGDLYHPTFLGDLISTQMLYDCFQQFSASSGLIANQGKSSIYFGGVPIQIFPLPKKILIKIESICKRFLWTGETDGSKKALVAWKQLCWPKTAGGLNITDIIIWNKAAILKHLWNLCKKKDRLWIQWMHTYYIKQDIILGAGKYLTEANINVAEVMNGNNYSIRDVYNKLRAIQSRLYTKDKLMRWGSITSAECVLCEENDEDHEHLFFKCKFLATIWERLLKWAGVGRAARKWNEEISWAIKFAIGRRTSTALYRLMLAGTVYYIWQERNWRIFRKQKRRAEDLDQKNNAVTSQNPTPKVVSGTKDAGEVNHEDDDAGIDSLNRNFYENEEFGPEIFVAGH